MFVYMCLFLQWVTGLVEQVYLIFMHIQVMKGYILLSYFELKMYCNVCDSFMKPKQKSVVKSILNCDFVEGGSLANKGFTNVHVHSACFINEAQ